MEEITEVKECNLCELVLPLEYYYSNGRILRPECKNCTRIKRLLNNKDRLKEMCLKYGRKLNKNKCEICQKVEPSLHLDHCHNQDFIRGALCSHCNLGLGHFKDNLITLLNAVDYLMGNPSDD